eukprot:Awhi_evm1s4572
MTFKTLKLTLDGDFLSWKNIVLAYLSSKEIEYVLNDESNSSDEDSEKSKSAKKRDNNKVLLTLRQNVSENINILIAQPDISASNAWGIIRENFESRSLFRLKRLKTELKQFQLSDFDNVDILISKLKLQFNRIDACQDQKFTDRDKIITLLEILEDDRNYDSFCRDCRRYERENPDKFTLNNICLSLKDEEEYIRSKGLKDRKKEKVNWVSDKAQSSNHQDKKDYCIKCLKNNHTIADCKGKWTCDHCGKPYHVRKSCWELHPELKPKPKIEKVNVQKKKKKSKPKVVPTERVYKSRAKQKGDHWPPIGNASPRRTLLDTAASVHVMNDANSFANICNGTTVIECVGGKTHTTDKWGTLREFKGKALLDESIHENILCVGELAKDNWEMKIKGEKFTGQHPDGRTFSGSLEDNLYYLDESVEKINVTKAPPITLKDIKAQELYHKRLGHSSLARIMKVLPSSITKGWDTALKCDICAEANMKRSPIRRKPKKKIKKKHRKKSKHGKKKKVSIKNDIPKLEVMTGESEVKHTLNVDFIDIRKPVSIGGYSKFMNSVLVPSFFGFGESTNSKYGLEPILNIIDNKLGPKGLTLDNVHSDQGGEFRNEALEDALARRGIIQTFTAPGTSNHNSFVENRNRTIVNMARAMMLDANLPKKFWGEALVHAILINNLLPTSALDDTRFNTPWEAFHGNPGNIMNLYKFGSKVIFYKDITGKFSEKGTAGILLGPKQNTVGHCYRIYNPETKRVISSRDIYVMEIQTYYNRNENTLDSSEFFSDEDESSEDETDTDDDMPDLGESSDESESESEDESEESEDEDESEESEDEDESEEPEDKDESEDEVENAEPDNEPSYGTRRSTRNRNVPLERYTSSAKFKDNQRVKVRFNDDSVYSGNISYYNGKAYQVNFDDGDKKIVSEKDITGIETVNTNKVITEPKNIKELIQAPDKAEWIEALRTEYNALLKFGTWESIQTKPNNKPIGSRFVLKVKRDENGNFVKRKARLVAQGYDQKLGYDYFQSSSPVMSKPMIRLLLSIAQVLNLNAYQADVKNAYLNSSVKEDIYLKPPHGMNLLDEVNITDNELWKLLKAIYGTKQAGRNWFELLSSLIIKQGFVRCQSEPCVFIKLNNDGSRIIIGIYVDDIICLAIDEREAKNVLSNILGEIQYEYLGEINHFIGWGVEKKNKDYVMHQSAYIQSILDEYEMTEAKGKTCPMDFLPDANSEPFDGPYQELVGSLLYLSCGTRPDIQFAVNACSRQNKSPTQDGWKCLKNILRYLNGTKDLCLLFKKSDQIEIKIYVDADYATDVETRRSRTGLVVMINGCPILWDSTMQKSTALSTAEAEYMAMAEGAKVAKWLTTILTELKMNLELPLEIYSDNQAAIAIATDYSCSRKAKHIDIRYHFIKEMIEDEKIKVTYCPSNLNIADIFTKPLKGELLKSHVSSLTTDRGEMKR